MKSYPSFSTENASILKNLLNKEVWATAKYDGSQIRAEWNPKKGFYKFGSKNELIDENSNVFGRSIPLIKDKYEESLSDIFKRLKYQSAVCFFEFFGPSSFAGSHNLNEQQDVVLFDINPYNRGILSPEEFYSTFGEVDVAKLLFKGFLTEEFICKVQSSDVENMPEEGVVCKYYNDHHNKVNMFKIKTIKWLKKLKEFCKEDSDLYRKLS